MTGADFTRIYDAMIEAYNKDKEVTNIVIDFQIKPILYEKKTTIINITTFTGKKDFKLAFDKNPNQKPFFNENKNYERF